MITAQKSPAFERIFGIYNSRLLRRSFHRIYYSGIPALEPGPVLYMCNHISWWDGLLAFELNRRILQHDAYVMMSEEGLRRFRFFRKLGAYSVQRGSPSGVRASLRYTKQLLEKPDTGLWLFPQGDIRHQDCSPLRFMPGLGSILASHPNLQVVPVTLYIAFLLDQKPDVFIGLGTPFRSTEIHSSRTPSALTAACESILATQLLEQRERIISEHEAGWIPLLTGKASISDRFTAFFRREANQAQV